MNRNIRILNTLLFTLLLTAPGVSEAQNRSVPLQWLGGDAPAVESGISWGVPWPRGEVAAGESFTLQTTSAVRLPLQNWTMAYWPDGSVKWTGFATVAGPGVSGDLQLERGESAAPDEALQVRESETIYEIDTGPIQFQIVKWGGDLFRSIRRGGREVARAGQLVGVLQQGVAESPADSPDREEYRSKVESVTLESSGPVRAVLKVEGVHKGVRSAREWLPFVVRFYFYAGSESVRMVHSVVYDGDAEQDMINGLGLKVKVPMQEQVHNRHIRFSGPEQGLWAEPIQPMVGRGGRFAADPATGDDLYPEQLEGRPIPEMHELDERSQNFLSDWAIWNDFRLTQPNADGFTIEKRTNPRSAWIPAGAGTRASGLVFAGDTGGGLAVSLKDFWQSYPSGLEVRNAASGEADLFVWLWAPDSHEMDMRHYDTQPHGLQAAYEDVQQGFSDAYGVARTSEMTLFATGSVPEREDLADMAAMGSTPPLITATPEYLHSAGVFGYWSLPDRSTPFKAAVEERLDSYIDFYKNAVEQHRWYGFWDFGDFMHSYDFNRNVWRYDLGGMAWANTELMPDMWLWYSFMRTGREDIFRMAEAMTRHTQEVDVHHLGRFAGLGSRHNVRHWGDGAKEVRISQSALKRYYYYLTTDERTGDLMREMTRKGVEAIVRLDPMRIAQPPTEEEQELPARLRIGPDWFALVGNWMTEWERTGDDIWKEKIFNGVESLSGFSYGLRTGRNLVVGLDPESGELFEIEESAGEYNLATIMGGGQIGIELSQISQDETWDELWLEYTKLYYAPEEVFLQNRETGSEGEDASYTRPDRLAAWVYMKTGNEAFAGEALRRITGGPFSLGPLQIEQVTGPQVLNPVDVARVNTNNAAQWSLSAIEILEMISDELPNEVPED
ncbi:MAG: hypothetical protein WD355_09610 [Balneolaceae bacterium]